MSAQCRLSLRCSLKVCWISIPIPYVACSCTESDGRSGDAEQGYAHHERQPRSRGRRAAPSDSEESDDERQGDPGKSSPGNGGGRWGMHPEPVVTEVVGLQVKGCVSGRHHRPRSGASLVKKREVTARVKKDIRRSVILFSQTKII